MTPVNLPDVTPMPRQMESGKSSQPREKGSEHDRFAQELHQQAPQPHELKPPASDPQDSGRKTGPASMQMPLYRQPDADVSQLQPQETRTSMPLPATDGEADSFKAKDPAYGLTSEADTPPQTPLQTRVAEQREKPSQSATAQEHLPAPADPKAQPAPLPPLPAPSRLGAQSPAPAAITLPPASKTDTSDPKLPVTDSAAGAYLSLESGLQSEKTSVAAPAPAIKPDVASTRTATQPEARDLVAFAAKPMAGPVTVANHDKKQSDRPQHTTSNHEDAPQPAAAPSPLTPAQMVLTLVSLPLSQPPGATPSGTADPAARAARPVTGRGSAQVPSSPREASDVLAPGLSLAENGGTVPDFASAFPHTMPENSAHSYPPDQGAASGSTVAPALAPHTGRADANGGALAKREEPAPPLSVKVLEVTTHFPVVPPSASLGESGQHAARPETTQAPTAAAAAAPAAPDAHQTALRTLNLALGGEDSTPVSVRMRLQGDQLNVAISSHHADAVAAMMRDHGELSQSLIGAGYKLDNLTVQLAGAPAGSGDSSGGGAAGQGQMARQQQGRSDQTSSQQNENSRESNGGNRGQLQQGLSDRERAAARARAALYI